MNLQEIWLQREKMWLAGSALIVKGNQMWKEISAIPGNQRMTVWLGLSEASHEASANVEAGYKMRLDADTLWHDAAIAEKGPSVKASWEYLPEKKSNRCALSTGEVFEP